MTTKHLIIKNRTYYFYNDLIKHRKTLIFIILVMLTKINLKIAVLIV